MSISKVYQLHFYMLPKLEMLNNLCGKGRYGRKGCITIFTKVVGVTYYLCIPVGVLYIDLLFVNFLLSFKKQFISNLYPFSFGGCDQLIPKFYFALVNRFLIEWLWANFLFLTGCSFPGCVIPSGWFECVICFYVTNVCVGWYYSISSLKPSGLYGELFGRGWFFDRII